MRQTTGASISLPLSQRTSRLIHYATHHTTVVHVDDCCLLSRDVWALSSLDGSVLLLCSIYDVICVITRVRQVPSRKVPYRRGRNSRQEELTAGGTHGRRNSRQEVLTAGGTHGRRDSRQEVLTAGGTHGRRNSRVGRNSQTGKALTCREATGGEGTHEQGTCWLLFPAVNRIYIYQVGICLIKA
ncbi:hypothetical protein P280DRAFT_289090 [Massarina eburnea CBS 473.64]|uniref:Uncharacterized protein n=1 Tax=Massarina eburnea CBS 473.64 TaxID=1395130 RepID=A0A6A6S339_9PLEO|nr:hypothetical protein P280DRAFT_289090 [Massarina eburnea CBS 473.64]